MSDCTEGGGLELQWLMKPLTGFADRVQYPLETLSRLWPAQINRMGWSQNLMCHSSHCVRYISD